MGTSSETYSPPRTSVKTVSARRRNQHARSVRYPEGSASGKMQDGARRIRALPAVARSDIGKFFPAQTQPIVPGLFHAIARGEIALVELVAFEDLRESGFHRQLFAVEDGI